MIAFDVAPLPHYLKTFRINAGRPSRAESNIYAPWLDGGCRRGIGVERMGVLRLRDLKEFQIADDAPRLTIQAQGVKFAAIRRGGRQPDLIAIDDGRRPTAVVNRSFP